jgi:hypothetical protein
MYPYESQRLACKRAERAWLGDVRERSLREGGQRRVELSLPGMVIGSVRQQRDAEP